MKTLAPFTSGTKHIRLTAPDEDLITHGWPQDIWFHADKLSSAHVYLRIPHPAPPWYTSWDTLPAELLADLAQLTKANSIEGNKKDNVAVVYTPWANLRKDGSMTVGQVSFHDQRNVRRVHVAQRENVIVNRLNKTKVERMPDLAAEKEERMKVDRRRERMEREEQRRAEDAQKEEWARNKYEKDHAYDDVFSEENMAAAVSNHDRDENWEDDFM